MHCLSKLLFSSLILCATFSIKAQITNQEEAISAEQQLTKIPFSEQKQSYPQLISFYSRSSLEKALSLSERFVAEAKKQKDKRAVADGLNLLGRTNIRMGNFAEAKQIHVEALFTYKALENDTGVAAQYGNLGVIYEMSGDFPKALFFYQRALKTYEKIKDIKSIAFAENNIGIVYQQLNLFDQSFLYQQKAFAHKRQQNDTSGMASTLNNIGVIYESLKTDYVKALFYYNQALLLYEKTNNNLQIGTILNNIGLVYLKQNKLSEADQNLINALKIRESINDKNGIASTLLNLAQLSIKQNQPKTAIERASKSVNLYLAIGAKAKLAEAYQTLADGYEKTQNYSLALASYKNHIAYRDSVFNESNQKSIHEMQAKYDYEVNQKQMKILEKENELKSKQLSQNRWILINILIVFSLVSAFVVFYIRQSRLKQRNRQLNIEHKLFRAQMNPHFIFNALASVQKFILDNSKEQGSSYITRFGRLMRKTLENSTREFVPLSEELEILEDYIAFQQLRFNNKFSIRFDIDPTIESEIIGVPPMLIQPFIENAIEHGVASIDRGIIVIDLKLNQNHLSVKITDNGVGINHREKSKDLNHKSLAIQIIKERLKILSKASKTSSEISITDLSSINADKTGTEIAFEMPLGPV